MPTYVISLAKSLVNDEQKSAIAQAVSQAHTAATGAPSFFVQVVFEEKDPSSRYLGGSVESRHVWVRGDIRAGRTDEQRGALMLNIMKAIARISKVAEENVWVYLNNLSPTDMVEYGHVLPAPGKEAEWFDGLPQSLRDYLQNLGTSREKFKL